MTSTAGEARIDVRTTRHDGVVMLVVEGTGTRFDD